MSPKARNSEVSAIDVVFSRAINVATFDLSDIRLQRNGGPNLVDSSVGIVQLSETTFRIVGLAGLTTPEGSYALTVEATGVEDTEANAGTGSRTETWTSDITAPSIVNLESVSTNPRNVVVPTLDVTFSEPINSATFDWQDVSLTRDGGANLASSAMTVSKLNDTTYRIANFTWVIGNEGQYQLSVNAAGIADLAGNAGVGTASRSWVMDTTVPEAPANLAIVPDTGASATDGLCNTNNLVFQGSVRETNLSVRLLDVTTGADLGEAIVTGTNFTRSLQFTDGGGHRIRVRAIDNAANVSAESVFDIFVDLSRPTVTLEPISPNPRATVVSNVVVRFSEAIDGSTFDWSDMSLVHSGDLTNRLTSDKVAIEMLASNVFRVDLASALTETLGNYELIVNGEGIADRAGNPGLGSTTNSWLRVALNTPPQINPIANQTVDELSALSFVISATDTDTPPNTLSYSLEGAAPEGASVDEFSGAFTWTPTELQGPSSNYFVVRVTDSGTPNLSATTSFVVHVSEVNTAPVLEPVPEQIGYPRSTLVVTNVAVDVDYPTNGLRFALGGPVPTGARIDTNTGRFCWTPTYAQAPSTNLVTVIVTDTGIPSLSATNQFVVKVGNFLALSAGKAIVAAGQTTNVPLEIVTSTRVTNVSFVVQVPPSRLTNVEVILRPTLNWTIARQEVSPGTTRFTLGQATGEFLTGTQQVGWLSFSTVGTQSSAFVPLDISELTAMQSDGQPVPRTISDNGRATVVAAEFLMECFMPVNQPYNLILYGPIGSSYRIETSATPQGPVWTTGWQGTVTNLMLTIDDIAPTNKSLFFRARD